MFCDFVAHEADLITWVLPLLNVRLEFEILKPGDSRVGKAEEPSEKKSKPGEEQSSEKKSDAADSKAIPETKGTVTLMMTVHWICYLSDQYLIMELSLTLCQAMSFKKSS